MHSSHDGDTKATTGAGTSSVSDVVGSILSDSSSSSSSSSSSMTGSSILGASFWMRKKAHNPIEGKPIWTKVNTKEEDDEGEGEGDDANQQRAQIIRRGYNQVMDYEKLLKKRVYPNLERVLSLSTLSLSDDDEEEVYSANNINSDITNSKYNKCELEEAVLMDCFSHETNNNNANNTNNKCLLFSHLSTNDLQSLIRTKFEKIKYQKHEIIIQQGTTANYLYVLYQGDIKMTTTKAKSSEKQQQQQQQEYTDRNTHEKKNNINNDDAYTVIGELAILTGSPYEITVTVTSPVCTLFRLDAMYAHRALLRGRTSSKKLNLQQKQPNNDNIDNDDHDHVKDGGTLEERMDLLKSVLPSELVDFHLEDDERTLRKIASDMYALSFQSGDILCRRGERESSAFCIIIDGYVKAVDLSFGGRDFEDMMIGPGQDQTSFGWPSMTSNEPMPATIRAVTDGTALVLSKMTVHHALGYDGPHERWLQKLAAKRMARIQLQQISIIKDSNLDVSQLHDLLDLMHRIEYPQNESQVLFRAGSKVEAAMYFVRHGGVVLEYNKGQTRQEIMAGGYFGEKNMLLDQNKDGKRHYEFRSVYTAIVRPHTAIDVLYLEECRKVIDTTLLGLSSTTKCNNDKDNNNNKTIEELWFGDDDKNNLQRHSLIGSGSFGKVWLATIPAPVDDNEEDEKNRKKNDKNNDRGGENNDEDDDDDDDPSIKCSDGTDVNKDTMTKMTTTTTAKNQQKHRQKQWVALKVQEKHRLLLSHAAERVVAERNIIASLQSPFVLQLVHSFQDEHYLYMVTPLLEGGELESLIPKNDNNTGGSGGLSEDASRFYGAGILEGLAYLHRRHIIHRDVKTENVLLNQKGYPVLIDLGFAKYVPDKTYTFCGSPMYTAPEIIRYKGHDKACDYWSFGVVLYRLVTGRYPFFEPGMDELALYKRICAGQFSIDGSMSIHFRMLLSALLYPDPDLRLGSNNHHHNNSNSNKRHYHHTATNGWREIFRSPWFASSSLDLRKLHKQEILAPWVPQTKEENNKDLSTNNTTTKTNYNTWMDDDDDNSNVNHRRVAITKAQQQIFDGFGPYICVS